MSNPLCTFPECVSDRDTRSKLPLCTLHAFDRAYRDFRQSLRAEPVKSDPVQSDQGLHMFADPKFIGSEHSMIWYDECGWVFVEDLKRFAAGPARADSQANDKVEVVTAPPEPLVIGGYEMESTEFEAANLTVDIDDKTKIEVLKNGWNYQEIIGGEQIINKIKFDEQIRTIVDYDPTTHMATIDRAFATLPDLSASPIILEEPSEPDFII